jgi:hypothetical protein
LHFIYVQNVFPRRPDVVPSVLHALIALPQNLQLPGVISLPGRDIGLYGFNSMNR